MDEEMKWFSKNKKFYISIKCIFPSYKTYYFLFKM